MEVYNSATSSSYSAPSNYIYAVQSYSYQFAWADGLNGIVRLEASLDGENWAEVPGSSQSTQGVAGSHLINVSGATYMQVKPVFQHVSGSGVLKIHYYYK